MLVLAAWATLVLVLAGSPSRAASPAAGSVGPDSESVAWEGPLLGSAAVAGPGLCASLGPDGTAPCDRFRLTVTASPAYWKDRRGGVSISVDWSDPADDFDLYVFDTSGEQVGQSFGDPPEPGAEVFVDDASGAYDVLVVPVNVHDAGYLAEATFTLEEPDEAAGDDHEDSGEGDDGKGNNGQGDEPGGGPGSGGSGGGARNAASPQPTSFGAGSYAGPPSFAGATPSFEVRTFDTTGTPPAPTPNPTEAPGSALPGPDVDSADTVTRATAVQHEGSPPRLVGLLLPLAAMAVAAAALAIFEPIRERREEADGPPSARRGLLRRGRRRSATAHGGEKRAAQS